MMKSCRKCQTLTDDFRPNHRTCKSCEAAAKRVWYVNNREEKLRRSKEDRYRREYGITLAQYEQMRAYQSGECAICNRETELVVDHSHKTGKVRGLLCRNCNAGIGLLGDSPQTLMAANTYLENHYEII